MEPWDTEEQERERVKTGAAVLDRIVPGWHDRVDLGKLKMSNGQLCMLGQLFGHDAETAIAKEMYPELWDQHGAVPHLSNAYYDGYYIGCRMIPGLVGSDKEDIDCSSEDSDLHKLGKACRGIDNKCYWAEEVVERRVKDGTE